MSRISRSFNDALKRQKYGGMHNLALPKICLPRLSLDQNAKVNTTIALSSRNSPTSRLNGFCEVLGWEFRHNARASTGTSVYQNAVYGELLKPRHRKDNSWQAFEALLRKRCSTGIWASMLFRLPVWEWLSLIHDLRFLQFFKAVQKDVDFAQALMSRGSEPPASLLCSIKYKKNPLCFVTNRPHEAKNT